MKHQGTKILKTQRLILRPIRSEDWQELFYGLRNQPEFLYYANKKRITKKQQKQALENIDKKYENLDYYNWVITQKSDGKIVGQIVLKVMNIYFSLLHTVVIPIFYHYIQHNAHYFSHQKKDIQL